MLAKRFASASTGMSYPFWYLNSAASSRAFCTCARASATPSVRLQLTGEEGTDHAGGNTAYSTVDFVDCSDTVRIEELVGNFLLAYNYGCGFGLDADNGDAR